MRKPRLESDTEASFTSGVIVKSIKAGSTHRETLLAAAAGLALLLACFGPHVAQHAHYHAFADQRALFGVPYAMDVLSNLPFALAGVIGLAAWFSAGRAPVRHPLRNPLRNPDPTRHFAALFFAGLIVTALGSTYYHLNPSDSSLAIDRFGMVASFAGMLGLAAAQRVSLRAGLATVLAVLLMGPSAVAVWAETGNLLPWAVLQGGGMVMLVVLAMSRPVAQTSAVALPCTTVALLPVVLVYTLAKFLELADQPILELTHQLVSGHSLKHAVAALAAWPVIRFMHNQNKAPEPKRERLKDRLSSAVRTWA